MKKILITIATTTSAIIPGAALISCSENTPNTEVNENEIHNNVKNTTQETPTLNPMDHPQLTEVQVPEITQKTPRLAQETPTLIPMAYPDVVPTQIPKITQETPRLAQKTPTLIPMAYPDVVPTQAPEVTQKTPEMISVGFDDLKINDIANMDVEQLRNLLNSLEDTKDTLTLGELNDLVDAMEISDLDKDKLEVMAHHYNSVATTYHVIKFALASVESKNITSAAMAWNVDGPFSSPNAETAQEEIEVFIKSGSLDVTEIVDSIIEKFSGQDPNFSGMVNFAYTVDQQNHQLVPAGGLFAGFAISSAVKAMGGIETLKYILNVHPDHWSIA